jgi:hypothetical protein
MEVNMELIVVPVAIVVPFTVAAIWMLSKRVNELERKQATLLDCMMQMANDLTGLGEIVNRMLNKPE